MQALENALEVLIKEIKNTDIYQEYRKQLAEVEAQPGLMEQIDEFRRKRAELQNSANQDDLFEEIDNFDREYEQFRENPVVNGFLDAELGLCRMMQDINLKITEEIDFE
ncbi:MAG: YlbF family regulator [Lachnospiraceae bacterium]|nr:YlbF family regulator [Lachnospiraceae bacterium]